MKKVIVGLCLVAMSAWGQTLKTENLDVLGTTTINGSITTPIKGIWFGESSGLVEPLSLGTNLSLSGSTLNAIFSSGIISSVGLTMPGIFSVSNSPLVANGTLGVTLNNESANTFLAAPSGTSGAVGFRTITPLDVPWATPGNIGTTTPGTIQGTTITGTTAFTGAGWGNSLASYFTAPAPIGTVTPNSGAFSTISAVTANIGIAETTPTLTVNNTLNMPCTGLLYDASGGSGSPSAVSCLAIGTDLSITSGTLNASGGGGGSLASVGLTMPTGFTVTNSPLTSDGTLAVTFSNETTNKVLAAPDGSTGTPTFRALATADIPWATPGTIGSGTPSTIAATTISGTTITGSTGFTGAGWTSSLDTFLASPPTIGGTTAGVGNFTTMNSAYSVIGTSESVPTLSVGSNLLLPCTGIIYDASGGSGSPQDVSCLTVGTNLSIAGGALNAASGAGGIPYPPAGVPLSTGTAWGSSYSTSGSGNIALTTSPTFTTPALGTPSAVVLTNATGTASSLTAGHVTTNANLTGPVTSSGNATTIAATGVTPGGYVNASIVVNAAGQLTSAGSGAIPPFWNVKTYGATGNGSTDDTIAIQSALSEAAASGGGTVYLPAGVYVTSSTLTIPSRTTILGDGPGALVADGIGLGSTVIHGEFNGTILAGSTDRWGIENIGITGPILTSIVGGGPVNTTDTLSVGISTGPSYTYNFLMDHVVVRGCYNGIVIDGALGGSLLDVMSVFNQNYGIKALSAQGSWDNIQVLDNTSDGLYMGTGSVNTSAGPWITNFESYNNGGWGINLQSQQLILTSGFINNDYAGEINIQAGASNSTIQSAQMQYAGKSASWGTNTTAPGINVASGFTAVLNIMGDEFFGSEGNDLNLLSTFPYGILVGNSSFEGAGSGGQAGNVFSIYSVAQHLILSNLVVYQSMKISGSYSSLSDIFAVTNDANNATLNLAGGATYNISNCTFYQANGGNYGFASASGTTYTISSTRVYGGSSSLGTYNASFQGTP